MRRKIPGSIFGFLLGLCTWAIPHYFEVNNMITQGNSYLLILVPIIIALFSLGFFMWGYWPDIKQVFKRGGMARNMLYLGIAFVAIGIVGLGIIVSQVYSDKGKTDTYSEGQFSKLSDEGIENTIRKWLDNPLYTVLRKEVPNTLYFQFDITDKGGRNVSIFRDKNTPNSILLQTYLSFSPEQIQAMKPKETEINRTISLELAQLGIGYHFENNNTKLFLETKVTTNDSLTEGQFMDSIILVIRGLVIAQNVVLQIIPNLPTPSP